MKKGISYIVFVSFLLIFLKSGTNTLAEDCTYNSTVTGNHIDIQVKPDNFNNLGVLQIVSRIGPVWIKLYQTSDIDWITSWADLVPDKYYALVGGYNSTTAYWGFNAINVINAKNIPYSIYGVDSTVPLGPNDFYIQMDHPEDLGTSYIVCTRVGDVDSFSSPSPTPSPFPTPSPSPSPSPSPTPTASPTPSPTPIPVKKVFFAPGLGGSWNLDAIMNCKTSNYSGTWQLAPFAKKVYQPFFDAINLTNWKLNTFYYDWRADVRDNGNLLNDFINSKTLQDEKVNFIGHSMGGLVGRSYMENNSGGKLDSYLSVGTPHKGSTYSYPTISAQDVESDDLIEKIATTILIKHCGAPISIQNLLPTYDYLKDRKTGTVKPVSSMKIKNNYLPTNFSSPFWGVKVGTLSGTGLPTLKMYETNPPSLIDQLRGVWLDGKPVKKINTNDGDGTVLLTSSQLDGASSNEVIAESHSGIIGTTNGINKILDFLGNPPVEDPPFVEPKSALVLIGNNGNFWIKDKKGKTIQSDQGVITIINPETSDFDFKYIPQNNNTLLIVAQFLPNGDVKYKEYKFRGYSPFSKKIHFNRENPKEDICNDR